MRPAMKSLPFQAQESVFSDAAADIAGALRHFPNWFFLAVTAVRLRYRRSVLGPLWISLTTALFIFFIAYLYSGIIATNFRDYLLNLALGWVLWHPPSCMEPRPSSKRLAQFRTPISTNSPSFLKGS